jgi:DNA-binding transcriptional regulator LsrR (DeoR family)
MPIMISYFEKFFNSENIFVLFTQVTKMPRLSRSEELRLLVKVSKLYYEENQTQDEILARLNLSRSKVSRLLQQARDEGIVKITVLTPKNLCSDLELALENRYALQEAVVIEVRPTDSKASITQALGAAAASYLERIVGEDTVIGISWGSTLNSMVTTVRSWDAPGAQIVQIIGGLGQPEAEVHATDLCRRLSRALGCKLTLLPAPGIVTNQRAKEAFLSDSHVHNALAMFNRLDLAFVGIGSPTPDSVMLKDGSIITTAELEGLLAKGAVGDIALRFFDASGLPVHSEIDERVIGINLDELAKVKRVVGVAGGPEKVKAVLGALRGKLIQVLITDSITARDLLQN